MAEKKATKKDSKKSSKASPGTKKTSKLAVIRTGGKQYLVKEGDTIDIEKIDAKEGEKVKFEDVLLSFDEKKVEIGQPQISKKIVGEVVSQFKDKKTKVFKYKKRKRYRRTYGHRQPLTKIKILEIS